MKQLKTMKATVLNVPTALKKENKHQETLDLLSSAAVADSNHNQFKAQIVEVFKSGLGAAAAESAAVKPSPPPKPQEHVTCSVCKGRSPEEIVRDQVLKFTQPGPSNQFPTDYHILWMELATEVSAKKTPGMLKAILRSICGITDEKMLLN